MLFILFWIDRMLEKIPTGLLVTASLIVFLFTGPVLALFV